MPKSLNDINAGDLAEMKNLAGCFFVPSQIAMMLELEPVAFGDAISEENQGTEIYNAYWGGWLQSEFDLRSSIMKMAKAGSTPAQAMMLEIMKLSKVKMVGT